MMRTAAVLGVAALLTTSALSGTLAKYTTSVNSEDSARVATWGFTQSSIDITGLFKNAYDADGNATVKGADGEDVIAPGTTNSVSFTFNYDGEEASPEVAYNFTVSTEDSECAEDIKNNKNIVWKLDDGEEGTWDELLKSIKDLSGDSSGTKRYEAGTLPTKFTANDDKHTVTWKWNFEGNEKYAIDDTNSKSQDAYDTEMGNKSTLDNVNLKITITATQID